MLSLQKFRDGSLAPRASLFTIDRASNPLRNQYLGQRFPIHIDIRNDAEVVPPFGALQRNHLAFIDT